jgi:uncharacterized transporter YbjL
MSWIEQFLVEYPELAVFLAISIGYLIGDVKFRGFRLGPVTGSLFAGILIGVRRCSNLGNGEVVFVPPVSLRHRLFGRTAILAIAETRRVEAGGARWRA